MIYQENKHREVLTMKKYLFWFVLLVTIFYLNPACRAVLVKGEAAYKGAWSGEYNYVDYIYTDEGPLVSADSSFHFHHGDSSAYHDDSLWYYYYQVENHAYTAIQHIVHAFSVQLDGGMVVSMGFISGHDLDNSLTFNHNGVVGDHEQSWTISARDPLSCSLTVSGLAPNVSVDFDQVNFSLSNDQSAVIFVTSVAPPEFRFSSMQNNESFHGYLPAPTMPLISIPEPVSLILLGLGTISLVVWKRKR